MIYTAKQYINKRCVHQHISFERRHNWLLAHQIATFTWDCLQQDHWIARDYSVLLVIIPWDSHFACNYRDLVATLLPLFVTDMTDWWLEPPNQIICREVQPLGYPCYAIHKILLVEFASLSKCTDILYQKLYLKTVRNILPDFIFISNNVTEHQLEPTDAQSL